MSSSEGLLDPIQTGIKSLLDSCLAEAQDNNSELPELIPAFDQLIEVMTRIEADSAVDHASDDTDITQIGEYALHLLDRTTVVYNTLGIQNGKENLVWLTINLASWIARHDGQIEELELVVDAIAVAANNTPEPAQLESLGSIIAEIINAVPPAISQDLEKSNPGRPWRVLLMNYSIVATRSHNTGLMEKAFEVLTGNLPEDASQFFIEGMQQMDALNYPAHVREVMEKYHRQWTINRSLH